MAVSDKNKRITLTISKELEEWFEKMKTDTNKTASELFTTLVLNWLQYKYCPLPEEADELKSFLYQNGRTKFLDGIDRRIISEDSKKNEAPGFKWNFQNIEQWDGYDILIEPYKKVVGFRSWEEGESIFKSDETEIKAQLIEMANYIKSEGYISYKEFVIDAKRKGGYDEFLRYAYVYTKKFDKMQRIMQMLEYSNDNSLK